MSNREEVVGWGEQKKIKSLVTYDDGEQSRVSPLTGVGSSWRPIRTPEKDINGNDWACNRSDTVRLDLGIRSSPGILLAARPLRYLTTQLREGVFVDSTGLRHGRWIGRI